jgi:hypothetical protein
VNTLTTNNNNKDTHQFTPTTPPIEPKPTHSPHQAGHVFAILEPARAFCTTRHARIQWNGGLSGYTCYGSVAVDTTPDSEVPAESSINCLRQQKKKRFSRVLPWRLTLLGACSAVQQGR